MSRKGQLMDLKFKWHCHEVVKELLFKMFSLSSILTFYVFLKIYKWMDLGPAVFAKKMARDKIGPYDMLSYLWWNELWPIILLIPVAIVLDIVIRRTFLKESAVWTD